ncbi:YggS family pyridoxal phosphate-dependent enzyme [Clostridium felsineum]|uniref:Pyridoxal phosphate homeostasis protein n=1 Tax=Clostridium felsineum TaxID=36839 RepID=A0A1S8L019_9CLOT|nr:YggS family pyridoxal phosphate-dependent enzyme [Clostridium felsineum]MCR3757863.1 YggS family pyridoxal phosphate-dependent enzyme [Clostridium felsineum]URZ00882.1 Pyridoxal phosphate homeostasis protein [Clostridium felsineum]URZ06372.1 Pyridoxal phosphate homeostasis protein [Clostridium felsineum]URZ11407.1 Pyridoxal phosphate homeostasis protein [Clostridium felsineum]
MGITSNLKNVREKIPKEVTLVAVSKTKPIEDIKEAYNEGVRDFGENKVQELVKKYDEIANDVRWHLIGHLQVNKVKYIVGKVFLIHSLDSIKLLKEIEKRYTNEGLKADVLIEINIGREENKTGILEEDLKFLLDECEKCSSVNVKGLMAVIPIGDETSNRFYFRKMKDIFDDLKHKNIKNIEMKYLSMGMTHDYEIAISEGANIVRVGEGIFGKRNYNKE